MCAWRSDTSGKAAVEELLELTQAKDPSLKRRMPHIERSAGDVEVFYILYEEVPMHVVETRNSRQGRRTVLQPAVEGLVLEMEDRSKATETCL